MSYDNYALVYDGEYGENLGDIPFYLGLAQEAEKTLELGCGTGRITIPLAAEGCRIWGLDLSESMLERARAKKAGLAPEARGNVTFLQGDMSEFELEQSFELIFVPFHSFQHLHTVQQQLDCLTCIRRHLTPEGIVAINLMNPNLSGLSVRGDGACPVIREHACDHTDEQGRQVCVSSTTSHDPLTQIIHDERSYETLDEDGTVLQRRVIFQEFRYCHHIEFEHLLFRAGFTSTALYGGYEGEEFDGFGTELMFLARVMTPEEKMVALNRLGEQD